MTYCQKSSQKKSFRWPHTEIWRISSLGCLHDLWLVLGSCGQRFHSVWSIGCHLLRLVREPTTCDYRPSPVITGWTAGIPHGYRLRPGVVGWARHRSWITTRLMKIYISDGRTASSFSQKRTLNASSVCWNMYSKCWRKKKVPGYSHKRLQHDVVIGPDQPKNHSCPAWPTGQHFFGTKIDNDEPRSRVPRGASRTSG